MGSELVVLVVVMTAVSEITRCETDAWIKDKSLHFKQWWKMVVVVVDDDD